MSPAAQAHPFTFAHELGHITSGVPPVGNKFSDPAHDTGKWRLMRGGGTSLFNVYNGSKRFTLQERNAIRKNPDKLSFTHP